MSPEGTERAHQDAPAGATTREPSAAAPGLRIAMLAACPFPTSQGTQVAIRHLATALARHGHSIHLVTYGYGEESASYPFALHRARRIDAGLRSGPSLRKPAADAALLWKAMQVCQQQRCQLLHAHNIEGLIVGLALKLRLDLPLVYHAHNAMGPELPTYFRGRWSQRLAALAGQLLDSTLPRLADATIVFDEDQMAHQRANGVAAGRLHVIPPGLDGSELDGADPREVSRWREQLGPGPWLLYAGNADAYQNLDLLWRSMAELARRAPLVRLLVVTHHEAALFQPAIAAAKLDNVTVVRPRDLEELRALYHLAEVGLCPRTLWTGAPIKILNYLAAGLPVVACRSGASHTLPPSAGRLVEADPAAIAAAALELLQGGRLLRRAEHRLPAHFALERHLPQYDRLYADVLSSRAAKPPEAPAPSRCRRESAP
jgi:1,2-diacylglycerol 3-alpha-glucosyltransferase